MSRRVIVTNYDGMTGVALVSPRPLWVGSVSLDGETYLYHNNYMVSDPKERTVIKKDGSCALKVAYHVTQRNVQEARAVAYEVTKRSVLSKLEEFLKLTLKKIGRILAIMDELER